HYGVRGGQGLPRLQPSVTQVHPRRDTWYRPAVCRLLPSLPRLAAVEGEVGFDRDRRASGRGGVPSDAAALRGADGGEIEDGGDPGTEGLSVDNNAAVPAPPVSIGRVFPSGKPNVPGGIG